MTLTDTTNMDVMINNLENYKYVYEGTRRTEGSYCLTFIKSLRTMLEKDPGMYEEACNVNSEFASAYFNNGYKTGFGKGVLVTTIIGGTGLVTYKLVKRVVNKNKNEGDVIDHE